MAEQQDGGEREPQPIDEEAAWAAIVAGYGEEPADPPGAKPFRPVEDVALPAYEEESAEAGAEDGDEEEPSDEADEDADEDDDADEDADEDDTPDENRAEAGPAKPPLGSSIVFAPGVRPGAGPRDYSVADPDDESVTGGKSGGGDDEGHFVPPEPPPLPEADATTKFAWLGAIGGPVLMLLAVLFQWEMTWWLTTVCVVGFLGGFATLVARMQNDDDDDHDDPGRGAVV